MARELIRAPAPKGDPKGVGDNPLDPVMFHLQNAMQAIRDLPIGSLQEEKFRTWIYNLVGAATNLIAGDSYDRRAHKGEYAPAVNPQLRGDLDDILGGGEGDDGNQRVADVPEVQEKPTGPVE